MPSTRARRILSAPLLALCAAGALTGTAAPVSAAGAASTSYAATWTFHSGGAAGDMTSSSGLKLTDYTGPTYYDRVTGNHTGGGVSVNGHLCATGGKAPAGISLYGAQTDWAQMPVHSSQGSRVNVSCVIDGAHHRFHWGNHGTKDAGYDSSLTTNCVTLTRTSQTTFTLTTAAVDDRPGCSVTQDVVYDTRLRQVGPATYDLIPFTATVTVPGLK